MKLISLTTLPEQSVSHNPEIKKKVLLGSTEPPHLTYFSQARFVPGQIVSSHRHPDMDEMLLPQV